MAASVGILFVDRSGKHLDRAHEELAVLTGGALEIEHEVLKLVRHSIERRRQLADLRAAFQIHALREVSASDSAARLGQNFERVGDEAGGQKANRAAQKHRKHGKKARGAPGFVDATI